MVNKQFSLLLSLRLKAKIPRRINYSSREANGMGWVRRALNSAQPPPSENSNRSTYFQIKGQRTGRRVVHAVILNGESTGDCLFRDLLRPPSRRPSHSTPSWQPEGMYWHAGILDRHRC